MARRLNECQQKSHLVGQSPLLWRGLWAHAQTTTGSVTKKGFQTGADRYLANVVPGGHKMAPTVGIIKSGECECGMWDSPLTPIFKQVVKLVSAVYGTRKYYYRLHNIPPPIPNLSYIKPVHTTPPHRIPLRTILILSSVLRLVFRLQFYTHFSCFASASYALPTSFSLIHLPTKIWWTEQIKTLILQFSPVISSHHQILSSAQCSRTHLNPCWFPRRFFLLHALPCFNT